MLQFPCTFAIVVGIVSSVASVVVVSFLFWVFFCVFGRFVVLLRNRSASPPGGNQVDGLPPALRFVAKIDILLELKMHHRGQNTPGDGHPRARKRPDFPDLGFPYDSQSG